MRSLLIAAGVLLAVAGPLAASAQAGPAAAYTTTDTTVGVLLADPAAKAIIDNNLPGFSTSPGIDMAKPMTLRSIQQFAPDKVTDKALNDIDAALAKLPPR